MSDQESPGEEAQRREPQDQQQLRADADVEDGGTEDQNHSATGCRPECQEEEVKSSRDYKSSKGTKRKHGPADDDDDDGTSCPICLVEWANAGEHRLVSLKCGHLFGLSCIERWLATGCGPQQRCCPQCKKKASRADVRALYARRVVVQDTAEQERLRCALEAERQEKNRLKVELAHAILNNSLLQQQLVEARRRPDESCELGSTPSCTSGSAPGPLQLLARTTTTITRDGGCRVLAFSADLNLLVVSQSSSNAMFPGSGVRKVDALDFRPTQFVHLHQKPVRDLAFHADKAGMLLSVGMDKRARLFDVTSNSVIDTFSTDFPLWSCCWDADNPFVFLVGGQNGQLLRYDTRHVGGAGELLEPDVADRSPLVSVACVASRGILACHLGSVQLLQRESGRLVVEPVPLHGPFFSLRYDCATRHALVSSRPSQRFPHTRHTLCQVSPTAVVHTFSGGTSQKLLSRPAVVSVGADIMVAAHEESSGCLVVWDVSTGSKVAGKLRDAVMDVCPLRINGCTFLTALTEKTLHVYELKN